MAKSKFDRWYRQASAIQSIGEDVEQIKDLLTLGQNGQAVELLVKIALDMDTILGDTVKKVSGDLRSKSRN